MVFPIQSNVTIECNIPPVSDSMNLSIHFLFHVSILYFMYPFISLLIHSSAHYLFIHSLNAFLHSFIVLPLIDFTCSLVVTFSFKASYPFVKDFQNEKNIKNFQGFNQSTVTIATVVTLLLILYCTAALK